MMEVSHQGFHCKYFATLFVRCYTVCMLLHSIKFCSLCVCDSGNGGALHQHHQHQAGHSRGQVLHPFPVLRSAPHAQTAPPH